MVPLSALVPTIGTRKPEAQEIATDSQKNHAKVEKRIWKKVKERKKRRAPTGAMRHFVPWVLCVLSDT